MGGSGVVSVVLGAVGVLLAGIVAGQERLVRGADGALYGTGSEGGLGGRGVVFRITDDGSSFAKLYDFDDRVEPTRRRDPEVLGADAHRRPS